MALFARKKEDEQKNAAPAAASERESAKEQKPAAPKKTKQAAVLAAPERDLDGVLRRPRITEKATIGTPQGVYVFDVDPRATKHDVALAVEHAFSVKPVKVRMAAIPTKKVFARRRGKYGRSGGGKKAYVYLKEGETIALI